MKHIIVLMMVGPIVNQPVVPPRGWLFNIFVFFSYLGKASLKAIVWLFLAFFCYFSFKFSN